MSTSQTIPKDPVYPPSMDWQFLYREGIRHIERLGSEIWTDYNLHDPGITAHGIFCYAINDVGNRCNFDPASLFAENGSKSFYRAAEILSCGPVTAPDIRKILVDIPGIKNAWVEQQHDADIRYFFGNNFNNILAGISLEKYRNLLDLNADDVAIPLVEVDAPLILEIYKCQDTKKTDKTKAIFRKMMLARLVAFNLSDNLRKVLLLYMVENFLQECIYFIEQELAAETKRSAWEKPAISIIISELQLLGELLKAESFQYNWDKILFTIPANSNLLTIINLFPEISVFLCEEPLFGLMLAGSIKMTSMPAENNADLYNLFIPQGVYSISLLPDEDRAGEEADMIEEALRRLHTYRNLCEDFHPDVHIIEKIGMGIDLAVELNPEMDTLKVLSNVFRAVKEYLSPEIKFYSLEQMRNRYAVFEIDQEVLNLLTESLVQEQVINELALLIGNQSIGEKAFREAISEVLVSARLDDIYDDIFVHTKKKYDADPVFKGPLLQHGFIDEEELMQAQPRQTIFRSDLYQVISEVEGVLDIDRLEIFKCDDTENRTGNWCLQFDCRCLPELVFDCSYFSITSHGIEIPVNQEKLREYLLSHPVSTTKLNREGITALEMPKGFPVKDLEDFTSTQIDFPRTYKIGNTGIDKKLPELRQAQAKQLQAYLFYFDQLLANYLSRLSSVKEILSINAGEYVSYQTLYNIPGIQDILLDFIPKSLDPENGTSWDEFKADKNNAYVTVLKQLSEVNDTSKKLFMNQVLDHMLARFGEKFSDFALQLYKIERPLDSASVWNSEEGLNEVIEDKKRFLSRIPELGSDRAKGFHYHFSQKQIPRYWKTENVEGVKKRVCAILGMKDSHRDTITCEPSFVVESGPMRSQGGSGSGRTKHEYYIKPSADSNIRILISVAKFSNPDAALQASINFLNMAVDKNGYGIVNNNIVGFWSGIVVEERTPENAIMLEPKENPDNPEKRLKHIQDLATGNCEDDDFHLLEHILLRPRSDAFNALLTPMITCIENIELLDPYSFWITVVMPDWTGRYSEPKRREAFMQTVMKEMPAHIATRFCLLSREAMFRFEKLYHDWLEQLCSNAQPDLPKATDELVNLMNSWDKKII